MGGCIMRFLNILLLSSVICLVVVFLADIFILKNIPFKLYAISPFAGPIIIFVAWARIKSQ